MALFHLPSEILTTIAIQLACQEPLLPPYDLLALKSTCHHLKDALNCHHSPSIWSAAFQYRFDSGAVIRRSFTPSGRDYYDQLRQYTAVIAAVRTLNVYREDIEDTLRTAYVMLLDNDGKNRAQLETAGIDVFVDMYVRTRSWSETPTQDGWPTDSHANAYALWVMWMLTTPEKLMQEVDLHREQIVTLLLPWVLNPYRYHQAEAPPSHFHLPLSSSHGTAVIPFSFPSAHGPYPVFVYPPREVVLPYFGAYPVLSVPPATAAAKLLYFARREIHPFRFHANLPRTRAEAPPSTDPLPTMEDYMELNSHKGAKPPIRVTWDWDRGCKLVNGAPAHSDDHDDSTRWDSDYWRRRLCGDAWQSQPKWRPGKVYVPGSMDGLWQGRLVIPMEQAMRHLIEHAQFPGTQHFNEIALRFTHQPLFMRLKENHALTTNTHAHVPLPLQTSSSPYPQENDDLSEWSDPSMRNAWFPGALGSVGFTDHPRPPPDSLLYSHPGQPKKVLVTVEGHAPPPGTVPAAAASPYRDETGAWLYHTFNRRLDAQRRKEAEEEGLEYRHPGYQNCERCREREAAVRRGSELDNVDHQVLAQKYEEDWRTIEQMFENVGLGRDETRPDEDMDEDDDEGDDEDEGVDIEGEESEEEELEFLPDANAEANANPSYMHLPVRRATDRAKIEKCDGIRDIIFSGTTDRRHAQAWGGYTFYGRVRPWDGLIGIIRRSEHPRRSFLFFYGYLIGEENFVGNWRFSAMDPNAPAWESAFVMSRRKDDELNDEL